MAQTLFPKQIFYDLQRLNPLWSDWICFCEAIKGKKYLKRTTIRKWFKILVDKDDYAKEDEVELLGFLYTLPQLEKGSLFGE